MTGNKIEFPDLVDALVKKIEDTVDGSGRPRHNLRNMGVSELPLAVLSKINCDKLIVQGRQQVNKSAINKDAYEYAGGNTDLLTKGDVPIWIHTHDDGELVSLLQSHSQWVPLML